MVKVQDVAQAQSNSRRTSVVGGVVLIVVAVFAIALWLGNELNTHLSSAAIAATRAAETCGMAPQTFVGLPLALQNELKDQCSPPPLVGP